MTPEQKRAYVLADNKLALNAGWDEDILAEELRYERAPLHSDLGEKAVALIGGTFHGTRSGSGVLKGNAIRQRALLA